jgi:hypothetical protein
MNLSRSQRSTSSASSSKKLGGRKSGAASSSRAESSAHKTSLKSSASHPSAEQVALRAYFIAERRRSLGIDGDETSDWIAAERELRAELEAK